MPNTVKCLGAVTECKYHFLGIIKCLLNVVIDFYWVTVELSGVYAAWNIESLLFSVKYVKTFSCTHVSITFPTQLRRLNGRYFFLLAMSAFLKIGVTFASFHIDG